LINLENNKLNKLKMANKIQRGNINRGYHN
jgi:hypothetical protein